VTVSAPAPAAVPHRSYRRLAEFDRRGAAATVSFLVALGALAYSQLGRLASGMSEAALWLSEGATSGLRLVDQTYLGTEIKTVAFSLEPMDYRAVWAWLAAGLVAVYVFMAVKEKSPAVFLSLSFVLFVIVLSALYLLFFGHLGYEGEAFSLLYVRTSLIVWLLLPLVVGGLSLTLPLTQTERVGYIFVCFASLVIVSTLRYALFILVLTRFGSLLMPSLFLFLGPLLDFVYLMSIFSLLSSVLARRLEGEAWPGVWSWL
jgi:hypothetical protein